MKVERPSDSERRQPGPMQLIPMNPEKGSAMIKNIQDLITQISRLEKELVEEFQKKEEEFYYRVKDRKVRFEETTRRYHKTLATSIAPYLSQSAFLHILTVPVIWSCLLPALLLDATVSLFMRLCFPIYKIPMVKRSEYIIIDRHSLAYLNLIEKINCCYCGYFNGLIAYTREIAGRTEQFWCPVKHARPGKSFHSRYHKFIDYGDGEGYQQRLDELRRNFNDLEKEK